MIDFGGELGETLLRQYGEHAEGGFCRRKVEGPPTREQHAAAQRHFILDRIMDFKEHDDTQEFYDTIYDQPYLIAKHKAKEDM